MLNYEKNKGVQTMKRMCYILAILATALAQVGQCADEITISGNLSATKTYALVKEQPASIAVDWTGDKSYANVSVLGTGQVALTVSSVTTNGYAFFRNISTNSTNTVSIAFRGELTTADLQLKAGEYAFLRLAQGCLVTNIYGWTKYNIPAQLYYRILED